MDSKSTPIELKEEEKSSSPPTTNAQPDEQSAAVIKKLLELHPNGPPVDPAVDHYYVLVELEIEKVIEFK